MFAGPGNRIFEVQQAHQSFSRSQLSRRCVGVFSVHGLQDVAVSKEGIRRSFIECVKNKNTRNTNNKNEEIDLVVVESSSTA